MSVIHGDCLEVLKKMSDNCVDTILTDPPYGISFLGKKWDYEVPSVGIWKECLRVLKPGGILMSFAGCRTQHRMACNIEDAGFELKDVIMWLFSGFPKSHDISAQIEKRMGGTSKVVGELHGGAYSCENNKGLGEYHKLDGKDEQTRGDNFGKILEHSSPEAKLWQGWKTPHLKPAYETILVAIKPTEGSYVDNCLKWGVGGYNIDGARIPIQDKFKSNGFSGMSEYSNVRGITSNFQQAKGTTEQYCVETNPLGRFPSNIIIEKDSEVGEYIDKMSGQSKSVPLKPFKNVDATFLTQEFEHPGNSLSDQGGASRFYKQIEPDKTPPDDTRIFYVPKNKRNADNKHPTIKPLKLMEYLCLLTKTPTGGIVLDPFAGSGTTGVAARNIGRDFILIEREQEYVDIIIKRLAEPAKAKREPKKAKIEVPEVKAVNKARAKREKLIKEIDMEMNWIK